MIIGYFNSANIITLFGLASAVVSCFSASKHEFNIAIVMLLLSGVCDVFDGRIARSSKRTKNENVYGVQLDSICDIVSFGVAPIFIAYFLGFNKMIDMFLYLAFIICGAVRLAYFNTIALETPDYKTKSYIGMPIPFSCIVLPFLMLFTLLFDSSVTIWLFRAFFAITALLYVLKIRIKKLELNMLVLIAVFELIFVVILFLAGEPKI